MDNDYLYHCKGCKKDDTDFFHNEEGNVEASKSLIEFMGKDFSIPSVVHHKWARADAYGIYTGLYCDDCYDDPHKYTYRKDEYYDPAYAGERMEPDE